MALFALYNSLMTICSRLHYNAIFAPALVSSLALACLISTPSATAQPISAPPTMQLQSPSLDQTSAQPSSAAPGPTPLQGGIMEIRKVKNGQAGGNTNIPAGVEITGPQATPMASGIAKEDNVPASVYQGWLNDTHPKFALSASTMADTDLLIVTDKYDQTERTLGDLGLHFTMVDKKEFGKYDISNTKVLVIDCGPKNLSAASNLKIREWVIKGGYLFTTDWMLDRLNQNFFPGMIAWSGASNKKPMYAATINGEHPFLFKNAVTNANWKMDTHCHLIKVLDANKVHVLAKSEDLAKDDPDRQGVLAVYFQYGRGYVMHMTAHFDRSQSSNKNLLLDSAPIIGISLRQAIAINYVVAGLSGTKL